MSSMRNAVSRRSHRERAQPLERRRLGLLEKHKDYSLRAKDFKKKKAQLKSLREKAADRNEDEFYFGMMSRKGAGSRIKDGRTWTGTLQGDRGNKAMDVDTVRLLKTQDLGYVRTMRQVALKELKKLEQQLILTRGVGASDEDEDDHDDDDDDDELDGRLGMSAKPKAARKIVFLEDEEERETVIQDQLDEEGDDDDKDDQSDKKSNKEGDDADQAKALRNLKRELEHARKKVKTLSHVETQLEVQRAKMAKTATSGGMTRRGKKIMVRTRKR